MPTAARGAAGRSRAGSITDVPGILAGHASDPEGATGFTVVLCKKGGICGLDVRGGAASLRNPTVALPGHLVQKVHALFFTGGSAFGLDAGSGVMRFLEERGIGFPVRGSRVPIVTGAVLFDLAVGDPRRRPAPAMAYRACRGASRATLAEGSVGAGTGATVGKLLGMSRAMKGGVGSCSIIRGTLKVGALAVVNAFGDVKDSRSGELIAGARSSRRGKDLAGSEALLVSGFRGKARKGESTTLGLVATNALLDREGACRLAAASQVALGRTLSPAHTSYDGDLVYALSAGRVAADPVTLEAMAVEALSCAIVRGVVLARGLAGIPSFADVRRTPARINTT
jgi:L-aminopeptidase/D-esterase-like protein